MKRTKLTEILHAVAPTLATALGGPLAGVATRAIADKMMGKPDASYDEVEAAVAAAAPGDLVKLRELDVQFKTDMKAADIQIEEIAAGDRASARDRQVRTGDMTPALLGLAIVCGFFGVLAYIIRYGLPAEGSEVLLIMVGALGAMTTQVGNYFFGSSTGSKAKDGIIAELKGTTS